MGVPIPLVVAVGVPEVLGSLVGQATRDDLTNWFATLRKPKWEPPGPLFGIAWTIFYAAMGVASWRVWVQGGWQAHQRALSLYLVQLVLNLSWPLVFFKAKRLGVALAVNLAVLATATATTAAFYQVDRLAGRLFLPYLAWLAFANALNLSVLLKNPQATSSVEDMSHGGSKRNPGEGGYTPPSRATAAHTTPQHRPNAHSRVSTVRVRCSPAPLSQAPKAVAVACRSSGSQARIARPPVRASRAVAMSGGGLQQRVLW